MGLNSSADLRIAERFVRNFARRIVVFAALSEQSYEINKFVHAVWCSANTAFIAFDSPKSSTSAHRESVQQAPNQRNG